MVYIAEDIGTEVILTEVKQSMCVDFKVGTKVTIVDITPSRGYTFEDEDGNRISECGFTGFKKIVN